MRHEAWIAWIGGVATVVGTCIALLTYCSPPNPPLATTPKREVSPPLRRATIVPVDQPWTNASGPPTFRLLSSPAIIEDSRSNHDLFVRFSVTNLTRVPVRAWVRAESTSRDDSVEAWTIDTGKNICQSKPDQFTIIPLGDPNEELVKYNDMGKVFDRAPQIASGATLGFAARFTCLQKVEANEVLFSTIRLTFGYRNERTTVYFQTSALPIFQER